MRGVGAYLDARDEEVAAGVELGVSVADNETSPARFEGELRPLLGEGTPVKGGDVLLTVVSHRGNRMGSLGDLTVPTRCVSVTEHAVRDP